MNTLNCATCGNELACSTTPTHSVREGHPAPGCSCVPGELGFAASNAGTFDNHGLTSQMPVADIGALVTYILSIE